MLRLDHVVYAVADLDEAAALFREGFGLDSVAGGRHERWGTANRIVPLGDQYLELVAAVDRDAAAAGGFGHAVMERADTGGGWITLAVATDDLGGLADRLGLEVGSGSRTRPDGEVVRWRMAGLDDPRREPWMPFFLAWDVPEELHPGRSRAGHGVRARGSRGSRSPATWDGSMHGWEARSFRSASSSASRASVASCSQRPTASC